MLHEGLTTGQAAKYISRHPKTLQAMDRAGVLPARRTASGRRYWLQPDLDRYLGRTAAERPRRTVCYCRVSSPSAAPGFEEPAADRGRVCHRQRYCQPGVYRGNWRWPKLQAAQVYGSGGFRCGRRSCHASRGPQGPVGALWVRAVATSVPQAWERVAGAQHGEGLPPARNGAGFDGDHALFFVPLVWLTELPPGLERGVKVILAHRIELDPTEKQKEYFRQACGTARLVWNWALEEWNYRYDLGANTDACEIKRYFNSF